MRKLNLSFVFQNNMISFFQRESKRVSSFISPVSNSGEGFPKFGLWFRHILVPTIEMAGLLIPATHFHSGDVGWYRGCGFEWFTVQIRRGRSFGLVLGGSAPR